MRTKKDLKFTRSTMASLIKDAGASRTTEKATSQLNAELSAKAIEIAELAVKLAETSGREIIKEKDILIAALFS